MPATVSTTSGCTRAARSRTENTRPRLGRCSAHRVRPERPHHPRSRPVLGLRLRQLASDPSVPVEGGSANDYDYASGDPVNNVDLAGTCVEDLCVGEALIVEGIVAYGIHKFFSHDTPRAADPKKLPRRGPYPYVPPKEKGKPAFKRVRGGGFIDADGAIWTWDKLHGDHWDVSHSGGGHTNVFPDGRVRGEDPKGTILGGRKRDD